MDRVFSDVSPKCSTLLQPTIVFGGVVKSHIDLRFHTGQMIMFLSLNFTVFKDTCCHVLYILYRYPEQVKSEIESLLSITLLCLYV